MRVYKLRMILPLVADLELLAINQTKHQKSKALCLVSVGALPRLQLDRLSVYILMPSNSAWRRFTTRAYALTNANSKSFAAKYGETIDFACATIESALKVSLRFRS